MPGSAPVSQRPRPSRRDAQQLLLRVSWVSPFGGPAHQGVAGLHFRAEGDARLVELGERRVTHVGDVGRFLG
jgi:hypothetical protein